MACRYAPFQGEALEILVAWGEKRREAMELIESAGEGFSIAHSPQRRSSAAL